MKGSQSGRKKSLITQRYRDTVSKTLVKIPWNQVPVDIALELVPYSVYSAVLPVAGEALSTASGIVVYNVLDYMIRRFTNVYESGEVTLSEVSRGTIPDARYRGVSEFWAKFERDGLSHGALVEITGLLSPYGPLTPSHPMSRPGYSVGGWKAMGDLEAHGTEEYDEMDSLIYGDRVIRLSEPRYNTYYAGIYDAYYGIANVALPLYLDSDTRQFKKYELHELWKYPQASGRIVTLKGRLRRIKNYYAQLKKQVPDKYRQLPSFGLEVFDIVAIRETEGVTHVSASIGWSHNTQERMITNYYNVQDKDEFIAAERELEATRRKHSNSLIFNYDDVACLSKRWQHKLPEYNEWLKPWLRGHKI
jgi:hypothetical protein